MWPPRRYCQFGHLVRHYNGRAGMRSAAILDIAQDHALQMVHSAGLFREALVFKGGTALRKFRAGNAGRFSTDLDFAVPEPGLAELVLETLDRTQLDGFSFSIEIAVPQRRAALSVGEPVWHTDDCCSDRHYTKSSVA
jgi:predicted nucleotidyltransferase component of viral defense system